MTEEAASVPQFKDFVLDEAPAAPSPAAPSPAAPSPAAPSPVSAPASSAVAQTAGASNRGEKRQFVSPLARKTAESKGVNLAEVQGTGPGGRVIKADVVEFKAAPPAAGI